MDTNLGAFQTEHHPKNDRKNVVIFNAKKLFGRAFNRCSTQTSYMLHRLLLITLDFLADFAHKNLLLVISGLSHSSTKAPKPEKSHLPKVDQLYSCL
jgi:hypothetical protein